MTSNGKNSFIVHQVQRPIVPTRRNQMEFNDNPLMGGSYPEPAIQKQIKREEFNHQDDIEGQIQVKVSTAYPLFKILRGIVKKFMLNELEIIFFLHLIEDTKWDFNDSLIQEYAQQFSTDFLNIVHEVYKPLEYKCLILYLICCAYTIKGYLDEPQEIQLITVHINQFMKKEVFTKFTESWRARFMQGQFKIAPRTLNKFYLRLSKTSKDQQKTHLEDYNALVDQIISISPPYSNEKQLQQQQQSLPKPQQQTSTFPQLMQISQQQPQYSSSMFMKQDLSRLNSIFQNEHFFDNNLLTSSKKDNYEDNQMNQSLYSNDIDKSRLLKSQNQKDEMKIKNETNISDEILAQPSLLRGGSTSIFFHNQDGLNLTTSINQPQ